MNILIISDLLSYGGASKLIYDLIPRFILKGHRCKLFILKEDERSKYVDELRCAGVTVDVLPEGMNFIDTIKFIKRYIEKNSFDVIHANLFPVIYYVSIIKKIMGNKCPPIFMTEHNTDNRRRHIIFFKPLEQYIYKSYKHVISISLPTQQLLLKWLGSSQDISRFSVVENGIDIQKFANALSYSKKSIFSNYQDGDILIGMVGRFTQQKNHFKMIEALNILPKYYKLILVGDGDLLTQIKIKVKDLKLEERVVFLGFRKDIAEIMKTVDLLCIPSVWEGFGLIAAEAMACKTPIACSNVCGLSDVVGDCAIKFNPNKSDEIANGILKLADYKLKNELIQNGYERVNKFDITNMANKYLDLFKKKNKN